MSVRAPGPRVGMTEPAPTAPRPSAQSGDGSTGDDATTAGACVERSVGLDASVWGPPLWDALFVLAFRACDATRRAAVLDMFNAMLHVIPCRTCRHGYQTFYARHPPPGECQDDPEGLAKWLWQCKQYVNKKLQRVNLPYADVRRRYLCFHALTSASTLADLLRLMALNVSDAAAPHLGLFATGAARAAEGLLAARVVALFAAFGGETACAVDARAAAARLVADVCAYDGVTSVADPTHAVAVTDDERVVGGVSARVPSTAAGTRDPMWREKVRARGHR